MKSVISGGVYVGNDTSHEIFADNIEAKISCSPIQKRDCAIPITVGRLLFMLVFRALSSVLRLLRLLCLLLGLTVFPVLLLLLLGNGLPLFQQLFPQL